MEPDTQGLTSEASSVVSAHQLSPLSARENLFSNKRKPYQLCLCHTRSLALPHRFRCSCRRTPFLEPGSWCSSSSRTNQHHGLTLENLSFSTYKMGWRPYSLPGRVLVTTEGGGIM